MPFDVISGWDLVAPFAGLGALWLLLEVGVSWLRSTSSAADSDWTPGD